MIDGLVLPVPVVERLDASDHAEASERDLSGARVPAEIAGLAGAVREKAKARAAGPEDVGHAGAGGTRDDMTARNRGLAFVEHQHAVAFENHEDLLLQR